MNFMNNEQKILEILLLSLFLIFCKIRLTKNNDQPIVQFNDFS